MRVLALVTDAFGGFGGIAQYNRDLLCALSAPPGAAEIDILPRQADRTSCSGPIGLSACLSFPKMRLTLST